MRRKFRRARLRGKQREAPLGLYNIFSGAQKSRPLIQQPSFGVSLSGRQRNRPIHRAPFRAPTGLGCGVGKRTPAFRGYSEVRLILEIAIQDPVGRSVTKRKSARACILDYEVAKYGLTQEELLLVQSEARHVTHLSAAGAWKNQKAGGKKKNERERKARA